MNKHQKQIFQQIEEMNPDAMKMDGYDDCVVGIVLGFKGSCLLYDMHKIIRQMQREGMTEDEAYEYFDYNVLGAWVGDFTPMFLAETNLLPDKIIPTGGLWRKLRKFRPKKK